MPDTGHWKERVRLKSDLRSQKTPNSEGYIAEGNRTQRIQDIEEMGRDLTTFQAMW
jgi:hypothetical protein